MSLELIAGLLTRAEQTTVDGQVVWPDVVYRHGDTITLDTEQTARLFEAGAIEDPAELGPATNPAPGDTSARWAASGADVLTDAEVAQLRALTSGLTDGILGRYERVLADAQSAVLEAWRSISLGAADTTARRTEEGRALHALGVVSAAVRAEMEWS